MIKVHPFVSRRGLGGGPGRALPFGESDGDGGMP